MNLRKNLVGMRTMHHIFMILEKIVEFLITVHSDFLSQLLTVHFACKECLRLYFIMYTNSYGTQCSIILNFTWFLKENCLRALSLCIQPPLQNFVHVNCAVSVCITVAVMQPVVVCSPLSVLLYKQSLLYYQNSLTGCLEMYFHLVYVS